jgi:glycosyltransferase involved in cell wall biosynthesis
MEILQVCSDSYGEEGGVSVHVRNVSERLVTRGHDVTVYATNLGSRLPRYELKRGVKVERFKCYAPSNAYFFSWEMFLRMRKVKFDVVHAHSYHAFPLHLSVLAKCKKFIATPHFHGVGHTPFRDCLVRLLKPFGERVLRKADKIIAVSEYEKSLICQQFGFDSDMVVVIPNGVDFSEFSGLTRRNRKFRSILYVGYLPRFKGVQYLVEVLPKLPEDVVLEIVGRGPLRPFLKRRARELEVYDRVKFYENLTRRELLQKYADADLFVLLSMYEAYSLVVAEALAAGTPCIVANTSALSEWIDNESCFGVNVPTNLDELAKLITGVLDTRVDRRVMKRWIGTKILDWNDVADKLESIYSR